MTKERKEQVKELFAEKARLTSMLKSLEPKDQLYGLILERIKTINDQLCSRWDKFVQACPGLMTVLGTLITVTGTIIITELSNRHYDRGLKEVLYFEQTGTITSGAGRLHLNRLSRR